MTAQSQEHDLHNAADLQILAQSIEALARQQSDMLQCIAGLTALKSTGSDPPATAGQDESGSVPFPEGGMDVSKLKERVKTGVDAHGNPVYKWACGNTKEELHQSIMKLLGGSESPAQRPTPHWSDYSSEWFEAFYKRKLKGNTAVKASSMVRKHISPMFGNKCIGDISVRDIQDALGSKSSYAKSYVRDMMNLMSQIFEAAIEDGHISRNPMSSSRVTNTGGGETRKRRALTREEQSDIIRNLHRLSNDSDRRFMAFLMYTGMRPGEIFGLRWEDIDFNNNMIHIQRDLVFAAGKSFFHDCKTDDSIRSIPLDPALKEHLLPCPDCGYVICRHGRGNDGQPYTEAASKRAWERIKSTIDVHGMTPYVGRHTFATNMSKAGVPMRTAISLMGHSDERMLMRHYVHTDDEDVENAGNKMAGFIGSIAM